MKKGLYVRTGTIAKMFGISSETMRFYAKKQIVAPCRIDKNGYWYYDRGDISHLFKAKFLQAMGFPLATVNDENTFGMPKMDWIRILDERVDAYKLEIDKILELISIIQEYRSQMEEIDTMLGTNTIVDGRDKLFYTFTEEDEIIDTTKEALEETRKWVDLFPVSRYGFVCSQKHLETMSDGAGLKRGFLISRKAAKKYGIREDESIQRLPGGKHVCTIICCNFHKKITPDMFEGMMDFAHKNGLTVSGDAYGEWIYHTKEGKQIIKHYKIWIPVEEK